MRDGGMSCDVTNNNEWKNSIHKTKNKVTVFPTIKYVHNTFYMLLNDNIFPHLIEKEILFILAK